jgi:hypothetical protein
VRVRLTVDLDHVPEWRFLAVYFNCRRFGEVEVERSPRGHGYHLIVRGLPSSREAELVLRSMLGDDPNRVRFDRESEYKPRNILFQTKWVNGRLRYDAQPLDERNVLALPLKSRLPRGVFVRE